MAKHGPKLEREQVLLGRFVDIGTELFAMLASCSRAQQMLDRAADAPPTSCALVDYFCLTSSIRVEELFRALGRNADRKGYKLAQQVMEGDMEWLERGIGNDGAPFRSSPIQVLLFHSPVLLRCFADHGLRVVLARPAFAARRPGPRSTIPEAR